MYYNRKGKKIADSISDMNPQQVQQWVHDIEQGNNKIVKQETLFNGFWVSTIFLGIDHNFGRGGRPLIFETMVANQNWIGKFWNWLGKSDWESYQVRYATEEEALAGHERAKKLYLKIGWLPFKVWRDWFIAEEDTDIFSRFLRLFG